MTSAAQMGEVWALACPTENGPAERTAVVVWIEPDHPDTRDEEDATSASEALSSQRVCRVCLVLEDLSMAGDWDLLVAKPGSPPGRMAIETWNELPVRANLLPRKVGTLSLEDTKRVLCARRWRVFPSAYEEIERTRVSGGSLDVDKLTIRSAKTGRTAEVSFASIGSLMPERLRLFREQEKILALAITADTIVSTLPLNEPPEERLDPAAQANTWGAMSSEWAGRLQSLREWLEETATELTVGLLPAKPIVARGAASAAVELGATGLVFRVPRVLDEGEALELRPPPDSPPSTVVITDFDLVVQKGPERLPAGKTLLTLDPTGEPVCVWILESSSAIDALQAKSTIGSEVVRAAKPLAVIPVLVRQRQ
jgi:hypothetical protein